MNSVGIISSASNVFVSSFATGSHSSFELFRF